MSFRNILLIDDDQDDQEIFLTALGGVDPQVSCSTMLSAETALEKLRARQVTADLIFLDLNMPIMNGQQFLREIKKDNELREIPVIVLSTSSQAQAVEEARRLGAHDFITKPDKFDALQKILRSIFSQ